MAVTVAQLAQALRLTDGTEDPGEPLAGILRRQLGAAVALADSMLVADAPDDVRDECVIRLASYWYDSPPAPRGQGHADAWTNSGAGSLAMRWVDRRAVGVDGDGGEAA